MTTTLPTIKLQHTGDRLELVVLGAEPQPVSLHKPVSLVKRLRADQVGQLIAAARRRWVEGYSTRDQFVSSLNDIVQQAPTAGVCLAVLEKMTRTSLPALLDLNQLEPTGNRYTAVRRLYAARWSTGG